MFKFEMKGLDKVIKKLQQMEKAVDELSQTQTVSFAELFTPQFMRKYTEFEAFEELLQAGNFEVNSQEDFEKIPDADFDAHISQHTRFSRWEDMLRKATEEYIARKLNF